MEMYKMMTVDKDKITRVIPVTNHIAKIRLSLDKDVAIDLDKSDLATGTVVFKCVYKTYEDIPVKNYFSSLNVQSTAKMRAIAKMYDIAHYYNNGAKPDFNNGEAKYYIIKTCRGDYTVSATSEVVFQSPCFINKDDAEAVIANPNFVKILDEIFNS